MAEPAAITSLTPAPTQTITAPTSISMPMGPPQFDPLDALPPLAAEKLRLLRDRSRNAHRIIPEFEEVRQASMEKIEAQNALTRLTSPAQDFGLNLKSDNGSVQAAQRRLDKATDAFKRITELQQVRTVQWQQASQAMAACEDRLKNGLPAGVVLEYFDTPEPTLSKGEDVLSGIGRLRRRVRELRSDAHRVESAPFPSNYVKAQMRRQIEALAMQGAPDITMMVEHDGKLTFPQTRVQSSVFNTQDRALAFTEITDATALLAWLLTETLIKALDREIDAESDDKVALSHEARQQRTAEIMGDLLAVERDEAALTWLAQSKNLPCEFRSDIDPIALLGLRMITVTNGHLPETSPMHVREIFYGDRR